MKIGFDAKRAYHNQTGLGNYSRTLINGLLMYYPQHDYVGFNPKSSEHKLFSSYSNYIEFSPKGFFDSRLHSIWRSKWITKDIVEQEISVFHGLSHELPIGIEDTSCASVVTIHDLIFEHFPEQYSAADYTIYRRKFKSAALRADKIIAISEATKRDLVSLYSIDHRKISVCLQSIDPRFCITHSEHEHNILRRKYGLPERYFLSVGSIIKRKNLINVCMAFSQLADKDCALVIVGKGQEYKKEVQEFISMHHLEHRVNFLEDHFAAEDVYRDLPLLYHSSVALLYPSRMEGFGLPIVEAYASETPVITSTMSSLYELGKDAAVCVHPDDVDALQFAMTSLLDEPDLRKFHIQKGLLRLNDFEYANYITSTMEVYTKALEKA